MPPRYGLSKRKARELLHDAKITKAPVPVEKLAQLVGASLRYEPFEGQMSGMVHRHKRGFSVIGVNSSHPRTRGRFTIAHELGHLLLHTDDDLHVDERFPIGFRSDASSLAIDNKEIEANQFAAELLMPLALLQLEVEKLASELDVDEAIMVLAKRFDVSLQAMTVRLTALGALK